MININMEYHFILYSDVVFLQQIRWTSQELNHMVYDKDMTLCICPCMF